MNTALLSSKKMDYCTPRRFFEELNNEFHFVLDVAATTASAKCNAYFTPETDGLSQSWKISGGGQCFAIHHMDGRQESGCAKPTKNRKAGQRLSYLSPPEQILPIFMTTYTAKRKSDLSGEDCGSRMRMERYISRHHFRPCW